MPTSLGALGDNNIWRPRELQEAFYLGDCANLDPDLRIRVSFADASRPQVDVLAFVPRRKKPDRTRTVLLNESRRRLEVIRPELKADTDRQHRRRCTRGFGRADRVKTLILGAYQLARSFQVRLHMLRLRPR